MSKNELALGPIGQKIHDKLASKLTPSYLEIIDESNLHHGHAGAHPSGESHFRVKIASSAFLGLSRVDQHRLINSALETELERRVHALAIEIRSV